MELFPYVLRLWTIWLLFLSSFATSVIPFEYEDDPSMVYTYNRFEEIQEKCGSVLLSPAELEPDDDRGNRIKKELSFVNGDWDQESGGAPLMPFDDSEIKRERGGPSSFFKLASFWVADVDPVRRAENMVGVSGILKIGISGNQPFNYRPRSSPKFYMEPGLSSMTILFEGVYIESGENGGQRLICLLGTSKLPTTNDHLIDSVELADEYSNKFGYRQPPLVQDDQILLVLRYTKTFSLISGNISGEMKSLLERSNFKYFDKVHLSSQLGLHSKYQYGAEGAEEILSKACSPYPYQDNMLEEDFIMFNCDNYCDILQHIVSYEIFDFAPIDNTANNLGPFILSGKTKAIDGGSNNYRLIVQNLRCNPGIDQNKIETTRVSALFRLIHSREGRFMSRHRTGLSGMTLSAEGIWRATGGQLCMVGCLGIAGTTSDRCNSRICLYIPTTFSLHQRSMLSGSITSINDTEMHASVFFAKVAYLPEAMLSKCEGEGKFKWSYKYSKITQARDFQRRSKPSLLGTHLRKSLLVYPPTISFLEDDLALHEYAFPYKPFSFSKVYTQSTYVELIILSVGSRFGHQWFRPQEFERSSNFSSEMIEIAGHLSLTSEHFFNVSLSVEGVYNSVVGNMYLIGCTDIKIVPENVKNEVNLESGMDCQFEVKIEYPPRYSQWLMNQEAKISISSKRSKEDSLYSIPISLKTNSISYHNKSPDLNYLLFRKTFEEVLRILMLIAAVVFTLSQFHYVNDFVDPSAYISPVMLGIQALGYCIPLITDYEVQFQWQVQQSQNYGYYTNDQYERFDVIYCIIKFLSLHALALTLTLGEKVYESRTRQISLPHEQQGKFPKERKIFVVTSVVGFLVIYFVQVVFTSDPCQSQENVQHYKRSNMDKLIKLLLSLDDYVGLTQDFFLLPQIVANAFWQIKGKPLRKLYYLGFSTLRVLLHAYYSIAGSVPNCHYNDYLNEPECTNTSLYTKFGNIIVAVIVILLAVVLHKQQQCNYQGFRRPEKPIEPEEDAHKSELFERLLS